MQDEQMKKNKFQDVLPPKRSIRDIELPARRRTTRMGVNDVLPKERPASSSTKKTITVKKIKTEEKETDQSDTYEPSYRYDYDEPVKKSSKWLYISVAILIIAMFFGISSMFKSAKIYITPRHQTTVLEAEFTAKKDDTTKGLAFQVVTVTKDTEKTVPASEEKKVEKKATGKIVVFNNYSAQSQKLVATTRFQTSEGLVFRTPTAVTIPGKYIKDGKTIPGSVEITVEADKVGEEYNIGLSDFVIPGFKGDSRYDLIYARSKTVMSGGFSGMQKVVDEKVVSSSDVEMTDVLKGVLQKDIISQIPDNFVLYQNVISYSLSPASQVSSNGEGAILKKRGTAYAIIFDRGALTRNIVDKVLPESADDLLKISNLDQLNFALKDGKNLDYNSNISELTFTLSGNPEVVWVFDENKLKTDILGLTKKQVREIINNNKAISEVSIETSPFWNQSITTKVQKVQIINTLAN